jgi:hypothetical protein
VAVLDIPSVTPSPSARLGIRFDVRKGVPVAQEALIRDAIAQTDAYLRSTFSVSGIDAVVTIVASKSGDDPRPASMQGGCCGATQDNVVYLDVDDPSWSPMTTADRGKAASHEFAHAFQGGLGAPLGCVGRDTDNPKRTPVWFYEGWAEYLAYQRMIRDGLYGQAEERVVVQRAKLDATRTNLRAISNPPLRGNTAIYTLGFVAAARLTDIGGPAAIRDFCTAVALGRPWRDGFQVAFGIDADQFMDTFNAYVLTVGESTTPRPTTAGAVAASPLPSPTPAASARATPTVRLTQVVPDDPRYSGGGKVTGYEYTLGVRIDGPLQLDYPSFCSPTCSWLRYNSPQTSIVLFVPTSTPTGSYAFRVILPDGTRIDGVIQHQRP